MEKMHFVRKSSFLFCGALIFSASVAMQKVNASTPVEPLVYQPVAKVTNQLSQFVYYYPRASDVGPVSVFLDNEFHTALLPGEYTVICVAPGEHKLSAVTTAALLQGKQNDAAMRANFGVGDTYFARAVVEGNGIRSEAVRRSEAESELASLHKQHRLINRAAKVKQCQYINGGGATLVQESLLFRFGGSQYEQLMPESRLKLLRIIETIKKTNQVDAVNLVGFTDGIGQADTNRALSEARAESIRQKLIENGIPASIIHAQGGGVASSAQGCSSHSTNQNDGCNQASRRVELTLQGQ
ncbi:TPA: OmpA family protein [Enterobacter cloacae]|uniref:OmpA family protein n=1 Tax=Enterobacter cloacae TaxID=550 RepID=UPI0021CFE758|nr:OmpA family protein [Enterobacter cloacae]MCU6284571.1 OmpA family protein [Enterobacter cloacae]HEC5282800.1 OmpA family protein [Enterobacter cloacae]